MSVLKNASARRAEKALREILDKADDDANGRVFLTDFIEILDVNELKVNQFNHIMNLTHHVQLEDEELILFTKLCDKKGGNKNQFLYLAMTPIQYFDIKRRDIQRESGEIHEGGKFLEGRKTEGSVEDSTSSEGNTLTVWPRMGG